MENTEEIKNNTKGMMTSHYGDGKLDKVRELNASMSIEENKPMDEYERKLHNLGGENA